MKTSLIPIDHVNSLELFTKGGLDDLLARISEDVKSFVPDLESRNGRKEIAATARKVASSKVVIDKAGKELVSEWKTQAKVVDASRRHAREFLDDLRDEIREPLTEWEARVQREAVARLRAIELIEAETEAHRMNEMIDREQAIKVREAEMERRENEKREAEAEEKVLAQVRSAAKERAERDAAEAIRAERERAEQAEREAKESAERERLTSAAAEIAIKEEKERAEREAEEASERAEREKQAAIENERIRAEAIAAAEKREEAARAADRENRRKVNGKIVDAFKAEGIGEKTAQSIVRLVASGGIPHMVIRY